MHDARKACSPRPADAPGDEIVAAHARRNVTSPDAPGLIARRAGSRHPASRIRRKATRSTTTAMRSASTCPSLARAPCPRGRRRHHRLPERHDFRPRRVRPDERRRPGGPRKAGRPVAACARAPRPVLASSAAMTAAPRCPAADRRGRRGQWVKMRCRSRGRSASAPIVFSRAACRRANSKRGRRSARTIRRAARRR